MANGNVVTLDTLKAAIDGWALGPANKAELKRMLSEAKAIGFGEGYVTGYMEGIVDGGDPDGDGGDRFPRRGGPDSPVLGASGIPGGDLHPIPPCPAPEGAGTTQYRLWDQPVGARYPESYDGNP